MALRLIFRRSLRLRHLPFGVRWTCAAALVLIAGGLRYLLFGPSTVLPFLLFFPAIIVSAVVLDRGSGFFATGLGALLAIYFFVQPVGSFALPTSEDTVSVLLFLFTGAFICALTESLHVAYVEAEAAKQEAEASRVAAEAAAGACRLRLREFGHRVRNDLQRIVVSMQMQARGASPEVLDALRIAAARIRAVGLIHEHLSIEDARGETDMGGFLSELIANIRASTRELRPIGIFVEAEENHTLSANVAGNIALIVNELVTNALKHAFPDELAGAIHVRFGRDGPDYVLTVSDDGVGMAAECGGPERGMGRQLIAALAAQLGGQMETAPRQPGGTVHTVRFPRSAGKSA